VCQRQPLGVAQRHRDGVTGTDQLRDGALMFLY
jgi:hypothetical protein